MCSSPAHYWNRRGEVGFEKNQPVPTTNFSKTTIHLGKGEVKN